MQQRLQEANGNLELEAEELNAAWRPCRCYFGGPGTAKRGIRILQLASFICATTIALVSGALFDAYLLVLQGSNKFVGDVESANGMAALAVAVPAGWLADRWSKSAVIKTNGVVGLVGAVLLGFGVLRDQLPLLVAGSVVLSMFNQCFFGTSAPLLAELTAEGHGRTKVISDNATMSSLGRAAGPALQLVATLAYGGTAWTVEELHPVLLFGLVMFLPYLALLAILPNPGLLAGPEVETAETERTGGAAESPTSPSSGNAPWKRWLAAILLEIGSLATAVGSGMTFKFWPLFFKGDYGFSPAAVCLMQLGIWIGIAMAAQLAPKAAKRFGRVQSCAMSHYVATFLLFVISRGGPIYAMVPLVLLRNAVMNSNVPVIQSLVMDLVPSKHRGKWSGIASLRRMTWSGSAFVGGWLSDSHDYCYAFFITACVHSISGLFLIVVALLGI